MTDSQQLLAEYRHNGSDAAFRELVTRYVDLVYSTALRLVEGDTHRAEDVAQTVFVDLARKAQTLPHEVRLGGWLHRDACLVAGHTMRGERRRQSRERQAVEMNVLQNHPEADFSQVAPLLDAAINELGEADRMAILLRFFEQQDFRAVGQALGSSEDAARMRVTRALDKLHTLLTHRGATLSAAALGTALATEAVTAAPAGLAATISSAAVLAETTITSAVTTTKAIAMTTLQKTVITAVLAATVGTGIYQARQAANARAEAQRLQQQRMPLTEQIHQLQHERDEAKNQLAALTGEIAKVKGNTNELQKLRGLVTRLRGETSQINDPSVQSALAWIAKEKQLRQLFEERPDQRIPDMRFLTDKKWLDLAKDLDLDSDAGRTYAIHNVRFNAKLDSATIIETAIKRYIEANNGLWPTDVTQLKPFLDRPLEDEILQRYRPLDKSEAQAGWMKGMVLIEKAAVDKWQETQIAIGPTTFGWAPTPEPVRLAFPEVLKPAMESYRSQNSQKVPADFNELKPYLTTPEQKAALDKLLEVFQNK
jgi:RNA polymerase sigma factor (sigma-70 family)